MSENQSTSSRLIAADKVQGTAVYNPAGERLGTLKDIYIDKLTGQAEFACMAAGGIVGVGARYHPLPWSMLVYDTDKDGFVVDMDQASLEAAPEFDDEYLEDSDAGWRQEVADYYAGHSGVPFA